MGGLFLFSNSSAKKQNNKEAFSPKHGGALAAAANYFDIPSERWLDLSTGINPESWPIPSIPNSVWQRLPEQDDSTDSNLTGSLETIALNYYAKGLPLPPTTPTAANILSCAGSQQAIRLLPHLFKDVQKHAKHGAIVHTEAKVWVTAGSFKEHGQAWEEQGYRVGTVACDRISQLLTQQPVDVLILVNPDNPSGYRWAPEQLLKWWSILQRRGGWLIVDEAFMDMTATQSLVPYVEREGLFVLRSVGKFFGLAGIRLGFMFAAEKFIRRSQHMLGSWPVSHPAQFVGSLALQDNEWIDQQRDQLIEQSARLSSLLKKYMPYANQGTELFRTIYFNDAERIFNQLAKHAVLVRYLAPTTKTQAALRFGLPGINEDNWQHLEQALSLVMNPKS